MKALLMLLETGFIILLFFGMYWFYKKYSNLNQNASMLKIIKKEQVSLKNNAYIIQIDRQYFLCVENCGIVPIALNDTVLNVEKEPLAFQKRLAKEIEDISKFSVKSSIEKLKMKKNS